MSEQREMFAETKKVRGKQGRAVLAHLQNEGPLTSLEALTRYGIGRLAAVVFDLRRAGYRIATDDLRVEKSDGDHSIVASYRLERA